MNDAVAVEEVIEEVVEETIEDRGDMLEPVEEVVEESTPEQDEAEVAEANEEESPEEVVEGSPEAKPAISIPKQRLDNEIARRKAYQDEAERLREQIAETEREKEEALPEYDFTSKIKEEYEAILEGDTDKAVAIRAEIDSQRMAQIHSEIQSTAADTTEAAQEQIVFKSTVADLTNEYPVFNPEHGSYDESLLQDVLFKRDSYSKNGMSMVDALSMATREVALINGIHAVSDLTGQGLDKKGPASGSSEVDAAAAKARIKSKLDDAAAQPPDMPGEASDSRGEGKLNVAAMSDEEFNALPEATLKRLRGD